MYLKEFGFVDCWKVSSVLPVFKNIGERSLAKTYCPVNLPYVVREVFEKLVNNKLVHYYKESGLLSDFQYDLRSSQSTGELLANVSDRIASTF